MQLLKISNCNVDMEREVTLIFLLHINLQIVTGGTLEAAKMLCDKSEAEVIAHCVIFELEFLNGREKLKDTPVISLVGYN